MAVSILTVFAEIRCSEEETERPEWVMGESEHDVAYEARAELG
jgi:hypothetical protein